MTWKNTERQIAKRLGGERVPITGRQRGSAPDIAHNVFSIEVKHRKKAHPQWIVDAVDQAQKSRVDQTQLPIVVLHESGKRHDDDLVVMTFRDFCEWHGR